jgi:hypothetical protein
VGELNGKQERKLKENFNLASLTVDVERMGGGGSRRRGLGHLETKKEERVRRANI